MPKQSKPTADVKTGRPSKYSQSLASAICEDIMQGKSLRSICVREDMPDQRTVYRWLEQNKEFRQQYTRAREIQADTLFDEIVDIADDASNDWMASNKPDSDGYDLNGEHIQRSRLRIESRKWMAGKLRPKKYGDKLDIDQRNTHEVGDSLAALMAKIDGRSRTK